jgi:hypothetical protein
MQKISHAHTHTQSCGKSTHPACGKYENDEHNHAIANDAEEEKEEQFVGAKVVLDAKFTCSDCLSAVGTPTQHTTHNPQHTTHNTQHTTHNTQHTGEHSS